MVYSCARTAGAYSQIYRDDTGRARSIQLIVFTVVFGTVNDAEPGNRESKHLTVITWSRADTRIRPGNFPTLYRILTSTFRHIRCASWRLGHLGIAPSDHTNRRDSNEDK
jgi:hypothetical protein